MHSNYEQWNITDASEIESILNDVRMIASVDISDLKKPYSDFQKARDSLYKALNKFQTAADALPEEYIEKSRVAEAIVLADQTQIAISELPNVYIRHLGQRLPKKGVLPKNRIVKYLAEIYLLKTGRRPTVSVDAHHPDNKKSGDFIRFLELVVTDAGLEMPALASRAKEMLKPNSEENN